MGIFNRNKDTAAAETRALATDTDATGAHADTTSAAPDVSGSYTIDPAHTYVGFTARHAMVTTVRGAFKEFEGTGTVDTATPANSRVDLTISVASIDTGSADRDGHLQSADFLDAATYPTITFRSTDVQRNGPIWAVSGDLTIKDVTRPVTIDFEQTGSAQDPFGNTRVGFEGEVTVNRKDWGLTWNAALETGGVLVSEKIKLIFDVSAIRND